MKELPEGSIPTTQKWKTSPTTMPSIATTTIEWHHFIRVSYLLISHTRALRSKSSRILNLAWLLIRSKVKVLIVQTRISLATQTAPDSLNPYLINRQITFRLISRMGLSWRKRAVQIKEVKEILEQSRLIFSLWMILIMSSWTAKSNSSQSPSNKKSTTVSWVPNLDHL